MRLQNWQERFSDFGKARASMPFAWGSNDCCTFAAAAVEAITGRNPMADVVPYNSEAGAGRLILRAGSLLALASQYLGEPVSPSLAAVGDVVLLVNEERELLGVCNGINALSPGMNADPDAEPHAAHGMVALGMESALAAWKI